jgi:hypothetical protein
MNILQTFIYRMFTSAFRQAEIWECPLLALSGHSAQRAECPLLGVKRTCAVQLGMSAANSGHRDYSITSSARASSNGGTARPSVWGSFEIDDQFKLVRLLLRMN